MDATIGLRLEQCSGSASRASTVSERLAATGRGPGRGRILIMDDEPAVRATMVRQLVICGFEAKASAEGQEAVEIFRQAHAEGQPFDAVILDLLVDNGWGGERTLRELMALEPGVKALLCSGSLGKTTEDYLGLGFRAVLAKPYALHDLRTLVEGMLEGDGE